MNYCDYCATLPPDNPNVYYHDHEYGFPIADDNQLFGRLLLEINQAGLNWTLILNKRAAFARAYADFDIARVAAFDQADIQRLLADSGIVRNRLKIQAAIRNAREILRIQEEYGSFKNWLAAHHPQSKADWVKLFKSRFTFVGGEIVGEFLMSTGYLAGAHIPECPVYPHVQAALGPLQNPWI